jgi:DNA-binding transcriptional regulator YiaG
MMNVMRRIRVKVFRVSQGEFALIAGVSQPTISKWEAGIQIPLSSHLRSIRSEAKRRAIPWNDAWFFEET